MKKGNYFKSLFLVFGALACLFLDTSAFAVISGSYSGVGAVAGRALTAMPNLAKLITAGSYVAGFGFAVAAIVKFKAHKDNPTQVTISMPIVLLFVGAALIFIPSVFETAGGTMFTSAIQATTSGLKSF